MNAQRSKARISSLGLLFVALGVVACSKPSSATDEPVGVPYLDLTSARPSAAPPALQEAGSELPARDLLPLELGNSWTYQVTGSSPTCTSGEHTRSIGRVLEVAGRQAFVASPFCGNDEEAVLARQGDQILQYTDGEWTPALAGSVVDERESELTADVKYQWRRLGWVKVPAGLFADCWERSPRDDSWHQIFCDGAGMVSMTSVNLRVVLTSFNLNHGTLVSRVSDDPAPG